VHEWIRQYFVTPPSCVLRRGPATEHLRLFAQGIDLGDLLPASSAFSPMSF
jgi:hypothetical protein